MSKMIDIDRANIWHPFSPLEPTNSPIVIKRAEGVYLYDENDKRIIDAISSWWVNIHGHSHPEIAATLSKQASTLEHVIFAGFTHEPAVRLSSNLLTILPYHEKIFFSDNGSTAVEVAMKMAIQYWHNQGSPRKTILAIEGAYHGDTFGAMSVGERGAFTLPFDPYLFNAHFLPFPTEDNINEIEQQLGNIDLSEVAAFIYEPLIQGASGMRMYSAAILDRLLTILQNKTLLIADEVMTGFGRTGKLFASDYVSVKPDLTCLSKGITGGTMPLGVTACNTKIVDVFRNAEWKKSFFHGHSFTANPLACAVANTSFEMLMKPSRLADITRINKRHLDFISSVKHHEKVLHARCLGTICAIELKTPEGTQYFSNLRDRIYNYFLDEGILLRPLGNIIYVLPPYVISDEDLEFIYSRIRSFLKTL